MSAPAHGQRRGHGLHRIRGTFGLLSPRYFRDLTAEQQTQIRAIRDVHKETFHTLHSQLREVRAEIADKLYGPGVVTEEVLTSQIKQLAELAVKLLAKIHTLLSRIRPLAVSKWYHVSWDGDQVHLRVSPPGEDPWFEYIRWDTTTGI